MLLSALLMAPPVVPEAAGVVMDPVGVEVWMFIVPDAVGVAVAPAAPPPEEEAGLLLQLGLSGTWTPKPLQRLWAKVTAFWTSSGPQASTRQHEMPEMKDSLAQMQATPVPQLPIPDWRAVVAQSVCGWWLVWMERIIGMEERLYWSGFWFGARKGGLVCLVGL